MLAAAISPALFIAFGLIGGLGRWLGWTHARLSWSAGLGIGMFFVSVAGNEAWRLWWDESWWYVFESASAVESLPTQVAVYVIGLTCVMAAYLWVGLVLRAKHLSWIGAIAIVSLFLRFSTGSYGIVSQRIGEATFLACIALFAVECLLARPRTEALATLVWSALALGEAATLLLYTACHMPVLAEARLTGSQCQKMYGDVVAFAPIAGTAIAILYVVYLNLRHSR